MLSNYTNYGTPLSLYNKIDKLKLVNPTPIFAMDIETINFNNIQTPIAISSCSVNNGKLDSKLFLINPISLYNKKGVLKQQSIKPIFTMDLETVYLDSIKSEVVIAISSCGLNNGVLETKIFLIDHNLFLSDYELAVKSLWNHYFNYLESLGIDQSVNKLTIFVI